MTNNYQQNFKFDLTNCVDQLERVVHLLSNLKILSEDESFTPLVDSANKLLNEVLAKQQQY